MDKIWRGLIVLNLLFAGFLALRTPQAAPVETPDVYSLVQRSGVLRCSYTLWPTYVEMDPNTKKLSGLWVDYLDAIGALLHLKIEWVEEVPIASIDKSLNTGRSDAYCGGLWQNASRIARIDYVDPITYQGIVAVARSDDHRFDADIDAANNKDVRIAAIDGETAALIARDRFGAAQLVGLPSSTDVSQLLMVIATGKADVSFTSPETVARFLEHNPGKLRIVASDRPLRVFAESLAVRAGEDRLVKALNLATWDLLNSGEIDRLLASHERYSHSFYRVQPPYRP